MPPFILNTLAFRKRERIAVEIPPSCPFSSDIVVRGTLEKGVPFPFRWKSKGQILATWKYVYCPTEKELENLDKSLHLHDEEGPLLPSDVVEIGVSHARARVLDMGKLVKVVMDDGQIIEVKRELVKKDNCYKSLAAWGSVRTISFGRANVSGTSRQRDLSASSRGTTRSHDSAARSSAHTTTRC